MNFILPGILFCTEVGRISSGKEVSVIMDKSKANQSIQCSVWQCGNHCDGREYCALDEISVGTHESDPSVPPCTDCQSFEPERK